MIATLLLLSVFVAAQDAAPAPNAAPAASTASAASVDAPVGAATVAMLKERFLGATDDPTRAKYLDQIAKTAPVSAQDVSALFDLFSRFPNPELRRQVMASLARIPPDSPQLEPLFVTYLRQPEAEAQLFGINGAFRLRSPQALPLVRKIAERKMSAADATSISVLAERNLWWAQYEALSALAQWQGAKALPLLRKKVKESPIIARLLGEFFWRRTFPDLVKWARSDDPSARQRALEAAGMPIDPAAARATRAGMLALARDPSVDLELRHRLALKAGASSTDDEVDALIAEHDKAPDDRSRLIWAAAAFASRSPRAIPLLVRYATKAEDEVDRKGARAQLVDMVGEEKTRELLGEKTDKK